MKTRTKPHKIYGKSLSINIIGLVAGYYGFFDLLPITLDISYILSTILLGTIFLGMAFIFLSIVLMIARLFRAAGLNVLSKIQVPRKSLRLAFN